MPYKSTAQLPEAVKNNLPVHAQKIFLEAFNHALEEYKNPKKRKKGGSLEEVAHKVAWNAVKTKYQKDNKSSRWVDKNN